MNTYNYENVECISRSTNQCRQIILLGETLLETHIQGKKYNNNNNNNNNDNNNNDNNNNNNNK